MTLPAVVLLMSLLLVSGTLPGGNASVTTSVRNATTLLTTVTTMPSTGTNITTTGTTVIVPGTNATTTGTTVTVPGTNATTAGTTVTTAGSTAATTVTTVTTPATTVTTAATTVTTAATTVTTTGTTATTTGATVTTAGPTMPTNGTTMPTNDTTMPTNGTAMPTNGTTVGPTTAVTPTPQVHSFRVNNSMGEVCMLLNFNAVVKVKYDMYANKTSGTVVPRVATINITDTASYEGHCNSQMMRNFTLSYPNADAPCALLVLSFMTTKKIYHNMQALYVNYTEPCFSADAVNYTKTERVDFSISYNGTVGKSYKCDSQECHSMSGRLNVFMDNILIQPFAQNSSDKGHFGKVETCASPMTTAEPVTPSMMPTTPAHKPTKPSPSNGGKIAGIVIGVLLAVALVVGVAVYVVRRRRQKAVTYGNLNDE